MVRIRLPQDKTSFRRFTAVGLLAFVNVIMVVAVLILLPKQAVEAQSAACAPGEVDTLSFMLPDSPRLTAVRFNTGQEESYSTVRQSIGGKSCFRIIKGSNFEEYCYDSRYIYFRQDTSWATGPNQDVMCEGTNSQATLSLVDPVTNKPGAIAFRRCQPAGRNFTFSQKIVPINEDTCERCTVAGAGVNTVTGRFEVNGDFLYMIGVSGAGSGEQRIFRRNCGLWGFRFSNGTEAQPIPGLDCQPGSLPNPSNVCTLGGNEPLILRDPATYLAQEGVDSAVSAFRNNYTVACAPLFRAGGSVSNQDQTILINGQETTLLEYCSSAAPGDPNCVYDPVSGDLHAMTTEEARMPYYGSEDVGSRTSSYMSFFSNESGEGDLLQSAPYYKLATAEDQCVQNVNILRAVSQICQTPPAENYQELVSSGTSAVLGTTTGAGGCPLNIGIVTAEGTKFMQDVFDEIRDLRDQNPNDQFVETEDFCTVAYDAPKNELAAKDPIYLSSLDLLEYVKKVRMFRNVYEVGYLVYAKDFVPEPLSFLDILFPFFRLNTTNRDEIPLNIAPVLFPYGLASKKNIESDRGTTPHDYLTGLYPQTLDMYKPPEEIQQNNNKYQEEIDRLQNSYPQGFPEVEDEANCTNYICCPRCRELIEQYSGQSPGFNEDIFKSIVGMFVNQNIDVGNAQNFQTQFGEQNNLAGLGGAFQYCRVTQEDIKGETSEILGSALVQPTIYQSVTDLFLNLLGLVRVAGGASDLNTVRAFVITPDESRDLRLNEGSFITRFLNPDYIEIANEELRDPAAETAPLLQMSGLQFDVANQQNRSRNFPVPGEAGATPAPGASPTPQPGTTVTASMNVQGDQMSTGIGGMTPGGLTARELFSMLANILSPPDAPTYAPNYQEVNLEEYWTQDKTPTGL